MKNYGLLFLFLILVSCDLFTAKKHIKEELVKEEMQHINWNDLDQYPLFENCDETADKSTRKTCFETTLTNHLKAVLQQHEFTVDESVNDTVWIHLRVDNRGGITISNIEKSKETAAELLELTPVFKSSITDLPKLYPALKRDIPVAAKFKIPVVLHVE